jgi:hypothetical protein
MAHLDVVAEFDGYHWQIVDVHPYPPVDDEKPGDKFRSTLEWYMEDIYNDWPYAFDDVLVGWDWHGEYEAYTRILKGEMPVEGTKAFFFGCQRFGEVSNTPEGDEYDSHWEWKSQVIIEPPDAAKKRQKLGLHVARLLKASGGKCTGYACDAIIDPRPNSEGQKRRMCSRCADKALKHDQSLQADPLFDLRKSALGAWHRHQDFMDEKEQWAKLQGKTEQELRDLIAYHNAEFDRWLAMWQSYQ